MRNIALLGDVCQALTQSSNTLMFASSALAVLTIVSPDTRMWANLPVTMQHLGVMLSVFPASMLMMRRGRRFGFRVGSTMGMTGALLAAIGLGVGSFPLMCVGGLFLGNAIANMQLYRFAAVELAPPIFRAQAISYVTAGGVLAGIIGPAMARFTPDLWLPTFQASFVCVIVLHVIVFVIHGFIDFPEVKAVDAEGPQRPLLEIITQPAYMVAASGGMIAFGVMSFVMAASPLAIVQCGLSRTEAPVTIFVHVMGMFLPSFFTVHLINRFRHLQRHDRWQRAAGRRRRRGAAGHHRVALPRRARAQRRRLEFHVRRRHHAADHDLPPGRARQGPGVQRLHGLRHHHARPASWPASCSSSKGWAVLNYIALVLVLVALARDRRLSACAVPRRA